LKNTKIIKISIKKRGYVNKKCIKNEKNIKYLGAFENI
jgi:hypothetical protein